MIKSVHDAIFSLQRSPGPHSDNKIGHGRKATSKTTRNRQGADPEISSGVDRGHDRQEGPLIGEGREVKLEKGKTCSTCRKGKACKKSSHIHKAGALKAYARRMREKKKEEVEDQEDQKHDKPKKPRYHFCGHEISTCPLTCHMHVTVKGARISKANLRLVPTETIAEQVRACEEELEEGEEKHESNESTLIDHNNLLGDAALAVIVAQLKNPATTPNTTKNSLTSETDEVDTLGCSEMDTPEATEVVSSTPEEDIESDPEPEEPESESIKGPFSDLKWYTTKNMIIYKDNELRCRNDKPWWQRIMDHTPFMQSQPSTSSNEAEGFVLASKRIDLINEKSAYRWFCQTEWRNTETQIETDLLSNRYTVKNLKPIFVSIAQDILVNKSLFKRTLLEDNVLRKTAYMCITHLVAEHPFNEKCIKLSATIMNDTINFIANQLLIRGLEWRSHTSKSTGEVGYNTIRETGNPIKRLYNLISGRRARRSKKKIDKRAKEKRSKPPFRIRGRTSPTSPSDPSSESVTSYKRNSRKSIDTTEVLGSSASEAGNSLTTV